MFISLSHIILVEVTDMIEYKNINKISHYFESLTTSTRHEFSPSQNQEEISKILFNHLVRF